MRVSLVDTGDKGSWLRVVPAERVRADGISLALARSLSLSRSLALSYCGVVNVRRHVCLHV